MDWGLCTSQCKPPHPPGRDIAGHLPGIFRDLTGERAAGIGEFDDFCIIPRISRGLDRGIFQSFQDQPGTGPVPFPPRWTGTRIVNPARWPPLLRCEEGENLLILISLHPWLNVPSIFEVVIMMQNRVSLFCCL